MLPNLFEAQNGACRNPRGAVKAGTAVHLRVCLPREYGCSGCDLLLRRDGLPDVRTGMFWAGMADDAHEWWECHFTPDTPQVVFYGFVLSLPAGERFLCREGSAAALRESPDRLWQITAYDPAFETPDWLDGGVMYQIFPDRFCASGSPKTLPDGRRLHASWGEAPEWRPDAAGVIRNDDFFGGDLAGITAKLPYLASLGVTCLYLNPIFEAASNHRYDTADYERIDPLLGDEADFRALCAEAHRLGIRVLLDGVFSHTGADSRYFNKENRYPPIGACNTPASPYASWYRFVKWPDEYRGWWGFPTLPEVEENTPSYTAFITGENGVVRRWMRLGADGWRLDVADELPDAFLDALRRAVKAEKPDGLLLGEVWEDASNKESYGHRRRYLLGAQLDSVMNYPFCDAILRFVREGDAAAFAEAVGEITDHYPPQVLRLLMNHVGTHDTARLITALAGEPDNGRGRRWQAAQKLSPDRYAEGVRRVKLASLLQYCLPGVPCLYYGDEAGMEGYRDPFNRGTFPWGSENAELTAWYRTLGEMRRHPAFRGSDIRFIPAGDRTVCFDRGGALCAVNAADYAVGIALPEEWCGAVTRQIGDGHVAGGQWILAARSGGVLIKEE